VLTADSPTLQDIQQLRPSDVLRKYYGSCPDGFRGTVSKTKEGPQPGGYYSRIHEVFANPTQKRIANVIRRLPTINTQQLSILMTLDIFFLCPSFSKKVSSVQQAEDLSTALELIRQVVGEEASNDALINSIRNIGENTSVCQWVAGWLARAKYIAYPKLNLGSDWTALNTGHFLAEAGLRFQNCLRNTDRIVDVLKGRKFYFESSRRFNRSGCSASSFLLVSTRRRMVPSCAGCASRSSRSLRQQAFLRSAHGQ
jgi:hypothetical protein